jgi:hypothetical protein
LGAHADHGDEVVGADADYGDVAGAFVGGEKEIFLGIESEGAGGLAGRYGETFAGVAIKTAVDDVDRDDAIRGGVADVHEAGVGAEDGAGAAGDGVEGVGV